MPYFATSDNCKLYYEVKGTGKPVVFIHGWDCNRHFFKRQLPAFQKGYQVVSFDLRGHGDSERPEKGLRLARFATDVKELIDYLDLKDVTLIGWSMGAHIIWEYIDLFGCDNLAKVVFIDMTVKMMAEPDENWPHTLFGSYTRADAMAYLEQIAENWKEVANGFVPAMFSDGPHQEEIPWVLEQAYKNTEHVMVNMWLAIVQKDYRGMLNKVTVPALVTYGKNKSLYAPENSEWLEQNMPNAKAIGFAGGHIHFMQDVENFNNTVMNFIEE